MNRVSWTSMVIKHKNESEHNSRQFNKKQGEQIMVRETNASMQRCNNTHTDCTC